MIEGVTEEKLKYCLYARKSTESDERQALSIESQVNEMLQIAERENLEVVDIRRESKSAKDSGNRPIFKELLGDVKQEKFNAILTWAPDRLSRNAGDLGSVVDLMDEQKLHSIRTYGQTFSNSPNEKFLLMILCSQAKLENDNRGINVKRGLRARCELGLWPTNAATGYIKERRLDRKNECLIDEDRAPVIKQMFEKVAYEQWSGRKLYHWLKFELNFRTHAGKKHLSLGNIYKILDNTFYYGSFEYPKGSGQWYQGKHEPIVTKELYDEVQKQLKGNGLKTRNDKEFAFTKLMTCGLCGSGISADEKYKKLKNGKFNTHIYYGCTKAKDKNCKCGYINEVDLISQLQDLVDSIELKENIVLKKLRDEVTRFKKFQLALSGKSTELKVTNKDVKNYVKFILKDGDVNEKRSLLESLESKIKLQHKQVKLN
ncbi:MAG TPA: recombinase family protein [Candidatus Paceibacterota bacterium]|nr:recombinase family protein [Candidatus Paceibacterota bacterium]HMO82567.1 recombinase family protein [Candidatus Paceibacterota bacterium]